ncbi:hypothetical protein E4U30_008280, partial [Claviceps sp. LM220 group G6]
CISAVCVSYSSGDQYGWGGSNAIHTKHLFAQYLLLMGQFCDHSARDVWQPSALTPVNVGYVTQKDIEEVFEVRWLEDRG